MMYNMYAVYQNKTKYLAMELANKKSEKQKSLASWLAGGNYNSMILCSQ